MFKKIIDKIDMFNFTLFTFLIVFTIFAVLAINGESTMINDCKQKGGVIEQYEGSLVCVKQEIILQ